MMCCSFKSDGPVNDFHEESMSIIRKVLQVSVFHLSHLLRLCQTPRSHWTKEDEELFLKAQSFVDDYDSRNGKKSYE